MLGWEECNSTVSENILKASLLSPLYVWMFVTVESFQWSYQWWWLLYSRSIKFQQRYQAVVCHLPPRQISHTSSTPAIFTQITTKSCHINLSCLSLPSSTQFYSDLRPCPRYSSHLTSHPTSDGSQMEKILLIWLCSVSSNKATPIWLICCPEQISYYPSQHNK